ncbi:hypothetical protein EXE10_01775 [Acinetobacter sp. WCHAc060033]|uniref:hypothetical protein n=1 Tax=Acinetobacter sp. WCHAc060033 TaxID=2518624 RepID=UPI001023672E|nr:hypothetical protein [Acinetobacter sp. WCHAc060033]RZG88555.1 hypothetical protein EXE10_01775 [Acinetobacter sp. WCHAc060033]
MKKIILSLMILSISAFSNAKSQTYTILNGGGVDDLGLILKDSKNKEVHAYCDQKCGDWFDPDEESGGEHIKKKIIGKKVQAEIKVENNRDRIVGPGANERLSFIKNIKLIK